jgi:ABC-2 type transport system ATP-binding protein
MIQTRNLTKRYRRLEAVNNLSFDVPEGSAFGLIGANGAGKSTTLKILMNMMAADSGTAIVAGVDSRRLKPAQLRTIGYVSENQRLPDALKVTSFFHYLRPLYPSWDPQLENSLRERFCLPAESRIRELSHGMRLKLTLAAALAFHPKLLVLDEPLGGLDPLARDEVMEGLLTQAGDTTVLISSHELSEIERSLTHVAYLELGRLRFAEPLADLNRRFREVVATLPESTAPPDPAAFPSTWIEAKQTGNVFQFVDTAFDETSIGERVRGVLGEVHRMETNSMGLRAIFLSLARKGGAKRS